MGGATADLRRTRRRWSEEEKRAIVAAACRPGPSIAAVARQHDLNANQLFGWRWQFSSDQPVSPTELQFVAVDVPGAALLCKYSPNINPAPTSARPIDIPCKSQAAEGSTPVTVATHREAQKNLMG